MPLKFSTLLIAFVLAFAAGPAGAQDKAQDKAKAKDSGKSFNVAKMGASEAQKRLEAAIRVSQAGRNCKLEAPIADKDDEKLTAFIDALTKKLRLDPNRLERVYYVKSFDEYEKDEAKFCETWGKEIPDFVKRLP